MCYRFSSLQLVLNFASLISREALSQTLESFTNVPLCLNLSLCVCVYVCVCECACLIVFFFLIAAQSNVADSVLEVVAHEARRLFRDRLVSLKDVHAFDNILSSIVRGDWGSDALDNMTGGPSCSILTGRHLRQTHAHKHNFFEEREAPQPLSDAPSKASKMVCSPQAERARCSATAAGILLVPWPRSSQHREHLVIFFRSTNVGCR